jgi:excisionase family DNA binding protein
VTIAETEPHPLTVPEVAARLRVSKPTVYRRIWDGILPAVRVGNSPTSPLRIPSDELEAWLDESRAACGPANPVSATGPAGRAVEPVGAPGPERSVQR